MIDLSIEIPFESSTVLAHINKTKDCGHIFTVEKKLRFSFSIYLFLHLLFCCSRTANYGVQKS